MKPENQVGENAKKKHTEKRPSNERVDTAFPGRAAPRTHSGGAWRGGSGRPGGRPVGRSPAPRPSGRERVSPRGPARPGTRRDRLEPRGAAGLPPGTGRPGRGGPHRRPSRPAPRADRAHCLPDTRPHRAAHHPAGPGRYAPRRATETPKCEGARQTHHSRPGGSGGRHVGASTRARVRARSPGCVTAPRAHRDPGCARPRPRPRAPGMMCVSALRASGPGYARPRRHRGAQRGVRRARGGVTSGAFLAWLFLWPTRRFPLGPVGERL